MVTLRNIKIEDIKIILDWNEMTEAFLRQWSNFTHPLTKEQYVERINSDDFHVFAIDKDGTLAGTIQLYRINRENRIARVGCYLIDPQMRGKGIGTKALELLAEYAFSKMDLDKLDLSVFDYNTGAIKCYRNAGYIKTDEHQHPMGWMVYNMTKSR